MLSFKKKNDLEDMELDENGSVSVSRQIFEFVVELLKVVLISLAIIIPVRYFLIQPFYVKGASMEPNFHDNEYLIIDEITYRFQKPHRGDIVVFRYPLDPSQYFIKRIIGLPGETVEFQEGKVYIYNDEYENGVPVDESYLPVGILTQGEKSIVLSLDEYYVLGDNRSSSLDSRRFGPVHQRNVIGKVWFRGWPFSRFMIFETPDYLFE